MLEELKTLKPQPLRPIKQVELYTKWGPLLPKWAAEITCPRPSDEVIKGVKENRNKKNRKKAADKKAGQKRKFEEKNEPLKSNKI